ncbi:outer spore coat protein CotE [Fictibacillus aquaticus]|uniref:Spore coat protein n=1 Tax=Fictibacillus aquaticus TaxID=2021314 RepID=A0A235FC54_9BACL|nr:outer spore coat protein CotE [Fictibacillus aquaticus]OYD58779.1 spore coat protein [Fictibacillus aquaticus]
MSHNIDYQYREIITRAVCGKGRKFSQATHSITPAHKPNSILGCWIINHNFKAHKGKEAVVVEGCYDVNLWYSYSGNTKTEVVTETIHFKDNIAFDKLDKQYLGTDYEVSAKALQEPNTLEATISPNGNKILVQVEREFSCEMIGDTKVVVCVKPDRDFTEDEETGDYDYEDIDDEEFEDLDPNFLIGELEE